MPPKARALIDKGFTEFGVQLVSAEAAAENVAFRWVMGKAGLTLVRTFRRSWPGVTGGPEMEVVRVRPPEGRLGTCGPGGTREQQRSGGCGAGQPWATSRAGFTPW
jgi:hypothetical protein